MSTTVKPGIKSTEFWLTLATVLLAAFMGSGLLPDTHIAVKIAAFALAAVKGASYIFVRGKVKVAEMSNGEAGFASPSLLMLLVLAGMLMLLAGAGGCKTLDSGLHGVQDGLEVTWELGYVPIRDQCRKRAQACRGKVSKKEECKPWVECDAVRELWNTGFKKASRGLGTVKKAHAQAKRAGLLKGGK